MYLLVKKLSVFLDIHSLLNDVERAQNAHQTTATVQVQCNATVQVQCNATDQVQCNATVQVQCNAN